MCEPTTQSFRSYTAQRSYVCGELDYVYASSAVPTVSQKRALSSPEDLTESKKNRIPDISDSESDTTMSTPDIPITHAQSPPKVTLDADAILSIAMALKGMLKDELKEYTQTLSRSIIDGVAEGIHTKIADLQSENAELKTQNAVLTEHVKQLETAVDAGEKYSRRNSLRINGIPEVEPEPLQI